MARHHFVPQFMLRRWATNGQINSFWWDTAAKKVLERPVAVRKACQIEDLNAFYGASRSHRNAIEDGFFTQQIDTPANDALAAMLSGGVQGLSLKQQYAWARFIVSLGVRTPETLRTMGPRETRKGLKKAHDHSAWPPDLETSVNKIIERMMPRLERNWPLTIAIELASDSERIEAVMALDWWTRQLDRDNILVGDRPLLAMPRMPYPCGIPLDHPACLIILPVSPNALFFASANSKTKAKTRNMSQSRLAHVVNDESIACADTYVHSLNSTPADLVRRKLAQKAMEIERGINPRPHRSSPSGPR
jgi:hypothetical protein